jgi:hypothetical protein
MTVVPLLTGYIIEEDEHNYMVGYRDSSFLFVFLGVLASSVSLCIMVMAKPESIKFGEGMGSGRRKSGDNSS